MFFSNNVQDTRQLFFLSWNKYRHKEPLVALEQQIVDVIVMHPEYHALLETGMLQPDRAYFPELGETNPFLHMGFHLAVRDQIATDRPFGIKDIYQGLLNKNTDPGAVEHLLMDNLAECLWQAQRSQQAPDEASYLDRCRSLLHNI